MASIPQCRDAIDQISRRLDEVDEETRREHLVERSVTVWIRDLDTTFAMRLGADGISDVTNGGPPPRKAQVRVTLASDDLVALAEDRLGFATAVLTGRVKVKASVPDMLRLRRLL